MAKVNVTFDKSEIISPNCHGDHTLSVNTYKWDTSGKKKKQKKRVKHPGIYMAFLLWKLLRKMLLIENDTKELNQIMK